MSENTSAPVALPEKAAPFTPFYGILKTVAEEANALRERYNAATKGASEAIDNALTTSEDATLVQWREFDAKIAAQIDAANKRREEAQATAKKHAATLVQTLDEKEVEALKTAYLEKRSAAHLTQQNILALLGKDEAAHKAAMDHFGIVQVVGLGGKSTTSGPTDIVRKRIASASVDGKVLGTTKDGVTKVTLTDVSKELKIDASTLRDVYAAAAKVASVRDIPAGTSTTFTVTSGDKSHTVVITTPDNDAAASEPENASEPESTENASE